MISLEYSLDKSSLNKVMKKIRRINSTMTPHVSIALDKSAEEFIKLADVVLKAKLYGVSEDRPNDSIFNNWDKDNPVVGDSNILVKTLYNFSPHAQAVEYGTLEATPIEPKYASVLKFKYAGFDMTAMSVRGQHPKHFVSESIQNNYIKKTLRELYKDAYLKGWSKI
jgi:hypothetical protein